MSNSKLPALLLLSLMLPAAFANLSDDSAASAFHQLNPDTIAAQPQPKINYFAKIAQTPSRLRSYVGLDLGADITKITPTMIFGATSLTTTANSTGSIAGDVYGGIGANFNQFYLGSELSLGGSSLKKNIVDTVAIPNPTLTIEKPFTCGLDLIPGFLSPQQQFLFYGRLGMGGSWFNTKIANNDRAKSSKMKSALRLGVGMEYFMGEAISLRLDYVFSTYGDITKYFSDPVIGAASYKLSSLNTNKITVGASFNF